MERKKDRHYVNHNDQVLVVSEKHMEKKRELQFVSFLTMYADLLTEQLKAGKAQL